MNRAPSARITCQPYPGLRSFRKEEADLFFGREVQIEDMLARLETHRFLAVVGTSGCGKSSLVLAGLLPALEEGFLSGAGPHWRTAVMRPGSSPFENLAKALLQPASLGQDRERGSMAVSFLQATLRRGPLGLVEAMRETHLPEGTNLLLVIDQFEEIFRYREEMGNDQESHAFLNLLLASTQPSLFSQDGIETPIYVVLTMRSDFIGDCALFAGLPERINDSQFLTPRMTRAQYESAIVEPARLFGKDLDDNLVNCILNELGESPDQLPVLQHCLMRMWTLASEDSEKQPDWTVLTLDHYETTGGLSRALSRHADEAFSDLGNDLEKQRIAQVLFRCLCERSQTKRDTRRPTRLEKVAAVAGVKSDAVKAVVEVFRRPDRCFIMPPAPVPLENDTVLDISHESLINKWNMLNEWVDMEAASAETYLRLADSANRWRGGKTEMLNGLELEEMLKWEKDNSPNDVWAARYRDAFDLAMEFLKRSQEERDRKRLEREQAERHKIELEARTQAQDRANKWLTLAALITGLALVTTIFLAVKLWNESNLAHQNAKIADQNEKIALSRALVLDSNAHLRNSPDLSLLLSLEALNITQRILANSSLPDAVYSKLMNVTEGNLRRALRKVGRKPLVGHASPVFRSVFSPDGGSLATASWDGTIRLWDMKDLLKGPRVLTVPERTLMIVNFSPDGRSLAAGSREGEVVYWAMADSQGEPKVLSAKHKGPVMALAFSSSGNDLASGGADNLIHVHDLSRPIGKEPIKCGDSITALVFRKEDTELASFSRDGIVRLWDLDSRVIKRSIQTEIKGMFFGATFSSDGNSFAYGASPSRPGPIDLLDLNLDNPEKKARHLFGHEGPVLSLSFSSDGHTLVSAGVDRTIRLWSLETSSNVIKSRIFVHQEETANVALSPDSHTLASAGWGEHIVNLWDLDRDPAVEPKVYSSHEKPLAAAFSPDGHELTFASKDEKGFRVRQWKCEWDNALREPQDLAERNFPITQFALSFDGNVFAVVPAPNGNTGSDIFLWDRSGFEAKREPSILKGPAGVPVRTMLLSRDGRKLVAAGEGHSVYFWDLKEASGTPHYQIIGNFGEKVSLLALSSDGKTLATAGADQIISLWDMSTSSPVTRGNCIVPDEHRPVQAIALSHDGHTLVSASADQIILKWDLTNRLAKCESLGQSNDQVTALALSQDGQSLLSASRDGTFSLWDLAIPRAKPRTFRGHEGSVDSGIFSSDGRVFASVGADRTIRIWHTQLEELRKLACEHAGRNMKKKAEWLEYVGTEDYRETCPGLPIPEETEPR